MATVPEGEVAVGECGAGAPHRLALLRPLGAEALVRQDGRHVGHRGGDGRGRRGLPRHRHAVLPREEVDEPEGEGVGPHVAQVGQGVEEGHVGAADGRVRDAGKERHDRQKPGETGSAGKER